MRSKGKTKIKTINKKNLYIFISLIIAILLFLILFIISLIKKHNYINNEEKNLIIQNINSLQSLQNKNIKEVEKIILQLQQKKEDHSKKKSISNKVFFEDSVFMGDSLTEPLDYYNVLNPSSVLAKKGQNVIEARNHIAELKKLHPKRVFLMYGSNDLELFKKVEEFEKNYLNLVRDIKKHLPETKIYIQSMTPILPKAAKRNSMLSKDRYELFLKAVKRIANNENVNYIDITSIVINKNYLYEPDGIHFTSKFYTEFIKYIRQYLNNS